MFDQVAKECIKQFCNGTGWSLKGETPCGGVVVELGVTGDRTAFLPADNKQGFDMWPVINCGHCLPGCKKVGCPAVKDQEWAAQEDAKSRM